MTISMTKYAAFSTAVCAGLMANHAAAALPIDAGPGYVLTSGGYRSSTSSVAVNPGLSEASASGTGLEIASSTYYNAAAAGSNGASTSTVSNAFVVTPTGYTVLNPVTGFTSGGYTARTINPAGSLITGTATGTSTTGAVWTPSGTAYTLPTPANTANSIGVAANTGVSINDSGTVVGAGNLYSGTTLVGSTGFVYFNTPSAGTPSYSTTPAQLLPVASSTAAASNQSIGVFGIAADGTAFGSSSSTTNAATITGRFATVWSAGNTAGATTVTPTALSVTSPSGFGLYNTSGSGGASQVNAIGGGNVGTGNVAVGSSAFFPTGSSTSVTQPVRWTLSSSTNGTVLSVPTGYTGGTLLAVNKFGDTVGDVTATGKQAAALWKAGSNTPVTLNPVTSPVVDPSTGATSIVAANTAGTTAYDVRGINDGGYSVGFALQNSSGSTPLDALVWDPNGNVTELNSLVTLTTVASGQAGFVGLVGAYSVTNDGWISGLGVYYDPANVTYNTGNPAPYNTYGAGTYYRTFEIQDPAVTPEPVSMAGLLLAAGSMLRRRRHA